MEDYEGEMIDSPDIKRVTKSEYRENVEKQIRLNSLFVKDHINEARFEDAYDDVLRHNLRLTNEDIEDAEAGRPEWPVQTVNPGSLQFMEQVKQQYDSSVDKVRTGFDDGYEAVDRLTVKNQVYGQDPLYRSILKETESLYSEYPNDKIVARFQKIILRRALSMIGQKHEDRDEINRAVINLRNINDAVKQYEEKLSSMVAMGELSETEHKKPSELGDVRVVPDIIPQESADFIDEEEVLMPSYIGESPADAEPYTNKPAYLRGFPKRHSTALGSQPPSFLQSDDKDRLRDLDLRLIDRFSNTPTRSTVSDEPVFLKRAMEETKKRRQEHEAEQREEFEPAVLEPTVSTNGHTADPNEVPAFLRKAMEGTKRRLENKAETTSNFPIATESKPDELITEEELIKKLDDIARKVVERRKWSGLEPLDPGVDSDHAKEVIIHNIEAELRHSRSRSNMNDEDLRKRAEVTYEERVRTEIPYLLSVREVNRIVAEVYDDPRFLCAYKQILDSQNGRISYVDMRIVLQKMNEVTVPNDFQVDRNLLIRIIENCFNEDSLYEDLYDEFIGSLSDDYLYKTFVYRELAEMDKNGSNENVDGNFSLMDKTRKIIAISMYSSLLGVG